MTQHISHTKKDINEILLETQAAMQAAIKAASIYFFEYYPDEDYALEYNGREVFGLEERLDNYPESWFEKKITHPMDEQKLRNAFASIKNGSDTAICKVRNRVKDEYRWNLYTFTSIYNQKGERSKVVCTAQDITQQEKSQQSRLIEEENYRRSMKSEKLLLKTRCNLTKDTVESIYAVQQLTLSDQSRTFSGGVAQLIEHAYQEKDRQILKEKLSKQSIQRLPEQQGCFSFEYRRKDEKQHSAWVKANVRVLIEAETQDTLVFVYLYDINAEKKVATIVNTIVEVDYEILSLIYPDTNEMECLKVSQYQDVMSVDYEKSYTDGVAEFIERFIDLEQQKEAKKVFELSNLKKQLDRNQVFEISFGVYGEMHHWKKWEFAYFDETHTSIIYSRSDVTEIVKEQEEQHMNLRNALLQAEEASKAKTDFLSRMSHEIRTPMNAIIGMNTLAMQVADRPDEVRDCLSKIGISARFLLSLINDILDMSRIESGKVVVKKNPFPLEEMLNHVNSIFYEQAAQKGVDYDCVISSFTYDYYIGDAMKIQQILVNLLGNAIKFTETGDKIQLILHQERAQDGKILLNFSVNDTGSGISEELQERMFEPFEQGDSSITTPYKGTGLGLAICKNLVNMMGGTIAVHSILGVGTEFTVRIPVEMDDEKQKYEKMEINFPMEQLHTLIVDDDVTTCIHTTELLHEMGMKAQWVDSGKKAVAYIQKKWEEKTFFDVVILDWKMPEMDGIETTREIRKIVGEEVTIIVMTAYDWIEIEKEAQLAGVNMLISKPLFKSSLISLYGSIFQNKDQGLKQETFEEISFAGKRVLLVEDHALNVEVARRLLEAKQIEVTVANNGLHAIERFMEVPDGYFDTILMDIRMPVMDGLTATKSIRQLHRAYAKTVPILAMSANAFEEDLEKSKEAGMNEHLSKPIEPQILYGALQKWFEKSGKNA